MLSKSIIFHIQIIFLLVPILLVSSCSIKMQETVPAETGVLDTMLPTATDDKILDQIDEAVTVDDSIEFIPPVLLSHYPQNGEVIPVQSAISLQFSKAMVKDSVENAVNLAPQSDANLSFTWEDDRTVEVTLTESGFAKASPYRLHIDKDAYAQNGLHLSQSYDIDFKTASDLQVIQTYPDNGASQDRADFTVQVVFNQPVVTKDCVQNEASSDSDCPSSILAVSPSLLGTGRWVHESVYQYTPIKVWTAGATYDIHVLPDLISATGSMLVDTFQWSFTVETPQIIRMSPSSNSFHVSPDESIQIWFNTPMEKVITSEELRISDENGTEISGTIRWLDNDTHLVFLPHYPLSLNKTYFVSLTERARALSSTPLSNPLSWQFHTLPAPDVAGMVPTAEGEALPSGEPVRIFFSGAIDEDSIYDNITMTPQLQNQQMMFSGVQGTLYITGDFIPQQQYCLSITQGVRDIYGHTLPESVERCFIGGDYFPFIRLLTDKSTQYLSSYKPSSLSFVNLNVDSANYRLHRLNLNQFISHNLEETEIIREWRETFLPTANQIQIDEISLSSQGNPLPDGTYTLEWQQQGLPPQFMYLAVVDLNIVLKKTYNEVLAWVTDMQNGLPISRTAVSIYNSDGNLIGGSTTDTEGLIQIPVQSTEQIFERLTAVVGTPGDKHYGVAQISPEDQILPQGISQPIVSGPRAAYQGLIWLNQQGYNPGDSIHYFGFLTELLDGKYSLSSQQQSLSVRMVDKSETTLYTYTITVSASGYFEGDIQLDDILPAGSYKLIINIVGEEDTIASSKTIQIAESTDKSPSITVESDSLVFNKDKPLTFYVSLRDNTGNLVGDQIFAWEFIAETTANQVGNGVISNSRNWKANADLAYTRVVTSGTATTDINGDACVFIPAETITEFTREDDDIKVDWYFQAHYTGEKGEYVADETAIYIIQPAVAMALAPRTKFIESRDHLDVMVTALEGDSTPIANQALTITLSHLDSTGYMDNVNLDLVETEEVSVTVFTDDVGEATASLTPKSSGLYQVSSKMVLNDGYVLDTREEIWVRGEPSIPVYTDTPYTPLIADKDAYYIGEKTRLLLPAPFNETYHILFTLESDRILTTTVMMGVSGDAIVEFPVLPNYAPGVIASVTAVSTEENGSQQVKSAYTRIRVFPPDDELLNVQIMTDQEDYEPGDQAIIRIRVTDQQLLPVDADVLVLVQALDDEASYPDQELDTLLREKTDLRVSTSNTFQVPYSSNSDISWNKYASIQYTDASEFSDSNQPGKPYPETLLTERVSQTTIDGEIVLAIDIPNKANSWDVRVIAASPQTRYGISHKELKVNSKVDIELIIPDALVVGDRTIISSVLTNKTSINQHLVMSLIPSAAILVEQDNNPIEIDLPPFAHRDLSWDIYVSQDASTTIDLQFEVNGSDFYYSYKPDNDTGISILRRTDQPRITTGFLTDSQDAIDVIILPETSSAADTLDIYIENRIQSVFISSLEYILAYPDTSTDVLSARLLATLLYTDLNENKLQTNLDEDIQIQKHITPTLMMLLARQNEDGGWGWWSGESDLYTSSFVVLSLLRAQAYGYHVGTNHLDKAYDYLSQVILDTESVNTHLTKAAFGLYVISLLEREWPDNSATYLYQNRALLSIQGQTFLALALSTKDPADNRYNTLVTDIKNKAEITNYGVYWLPLPAEDVGSDTLTTAQVLYLLLDLGSETGLEGDIIRYLMLSRKVEHWMTPMESAWSLMAIAKYFAHTGFSESSFDWSVYINDVILVDNKTQNNDLSAFEKTINLGLYNNDIILNKENIIAFNRGPGLGSLYYATILSTAVPFEFDNASPYRGITINREYCRNQADLSALPSLLKTACEPVQQLKEGTTVEVRITIYLSEDKYNLKVLDYIPSGFIPYDMEKSPADFNSDTNTIHICNNNRCMFYYDELRRGIHQLSYQLKAVVPGDFHILPVLLIDTINPDNRVESDVWQLTVLNE